MQQRARVLLAALCALTFCFISVNGLGTVLLPGDVYIEFIGSVYSGSSCRVPDVKVLQAINAIKWTLGRLNDVNFTNGLKLGLRVSPTCQSVERATQVTHQLIVEMGNNDTIDVVGVIGSEFSSESEAISRMLSSMPDQYRLLQVSWGATSASLRNRELYRNFFRTIPADDIQVQVMYEFLVAARWTMITMIYINDSYGRGGFRELSERLVGSDICVVGTVAIEPEKYNVTMLEDVVRNKVYKINETRNEPPVSGIIVFGSYQILEALFQAIHNLENDNKTAHFNRPSLILSETGTYFEGKFPNVSKGAFVLSPPRRIISEFQTHWKNSLTISETLKAEANANRFFKEMFEGLMNCQFSNEVHLNYCRPMAPEEQTMHAAQSMYTQYAIQSALVTAFSVKRVHSTACLTGGACDAFNFVNMTKRSAFIDAIQNQNIVFDRDFGGLRLQEFQSQPPLTALTVRFEGSSDVKFVPSNMFPEYELYNHRLDSVRCSQKDAPCLIKVATYNKLTSLDKSLLSDIRDYEDNNTVLSWPNIRKSQCTDGYRSDFCLSQRSDPSVLYHKGDMYIVGIVPVHNTGTTPLKCGNIKRGGLDNVEAIRYGISTGSGAFGGAKIGVILIDSCNDPQIIQEKILTLHRLGVYVDGKYEPVADKILGYVGGWGSDVTTAAAKITSRLGLVQISYASTAPSLSDRDVYPYFLRVPSADDYQAATLLKIVKALGGSTIQVIYSETIYGEGGRGLIQKLAAKPEYNLCIGNEIGVSKNTDPTTIVESLRKSKESQIVVAFIGSFELEYIIGYLNEKLDLNEFLFVASEGWGLRSDMFRYRNLQGTITVVSRLWTTDGFKSHLKALRPDNKDNPWLLPYMEMIYGCYFESSFDKSSYRKCNGTENLDEAKGVYSIDSWAPFAERAVSVLLKGAASTLQKVCGTALSVCPEYYNSTGVLLTEVKRQEELAEPQDIATRRVFNDNGDGTIGYRIYAIDVNGKANKLGTSDSLGFQFPVLQYYTYRPSASITTKCTDGVVCRKCYTQPTSPPGSGQTAFPGGAVAAIVALAVFACVLLVVLLCIWKRTGCHLRCDALNPPLDDTYLTAPLDNTYLTAIYAEQRRNHGVDGSETPTTVIKTTDDYHLLNHKRVAMERPAGSFPRGDNIQSVAVLPGNENVTSVVPCVGTLNSKSSDNNLQAPPAHDLGAFKTSSKHVTLSKSDLTAPIHSNIPALEQQGASRDAVDTVTGL
ncbi:uncharacterized protein LOC127860900 [Dreissena polymorpha]|uniref:Receptor ligand binding region domain-containing protein n=1 Tax=Dreissena polymorpha TaxID=45954 RepID=A0A9D4BEQ0_DREPO|nr:uncharacterized protein LOC127860900 [Dreissena polymorpha]KAH3700245.1 hypothetical protein DPMN_075218 [Dreissena polymorpha]